MNNFQNTCYLFLPFSITNTSSIIRVSAIRDQYHLDLIPYGTDSSESVLYCQNTDSGDSDKNINV
jgi:hypothetical protein